MEGSKPFRRFDLFRVFPEYSREVSAHAVSAKSRWLDWLFFIPKGGEIHKEPRMKSLQYGMITCLLCESWRGHPPGPFFKGPDRATIETQGFEALDIYGLWCVANGLG